MKKVLFAGALAACMALSSAAFADDVEFGTDGITGTYNKDNGTVSVASIPTDLTTGADQLTLVILSGASTDNPTIVKESIMYIDQDSVSNAEKFQSMGLLNGLKDGPYTLRMGSDAAAAIAEVEFTVTSGTKPGTKTIQFMFGDVNSTYTEDAPIRDMIDASDAADILKIASGSEDFNKNGAYSIGDVITDKAGKTFMFGDVNSTYTEGAVIRDLIDASDAADILKIASGSEDFNKNGAYAIGDVVSVEVPIE